MNQEERAPGAAAGPEAAPRSLENLPRAGFWLRLGATALDGLVCAVAAALLQLHAFVWLCWAAYLVGFWTWKGTTLGGVVCGVKGVRLDGSAMTFGVALVRHLASYLSLCALGLGYLWAAFDKDKQAWHDKIAGTLVVRLPKGEPLI